jgi:hypothetical protein
MAISAETLRLSRELRITIAQVADQHTRDLVKAWALAWDDLRAELDAALLDLAGIEPGTWPNRAQINRATRARKALGAVEDALGKLADDARITITDALGEVVDLSSAAQGRIIASQLPEQAGTSAELAAQFDRTDPETLAAIVARSTEQITALSRPLSAAATEEMRRALVRGVAVGDNPRTTASRMLARLEGVFNGGLTRALVIARTETLDAHRAGAAAQQWANRDVLAGWVWQAELGSRTCPGCWAKHGTEHPLDEDGPLDHQQGRCTRLPLTKTWRELGFDIREPASVLPDARTAFRAMPERDQLAVMGAARLDALNSGRAQWADLATRRTTAGWRDSYAPTPVRDLAGVS